MRKVKKVKDLPNGFKKTYYVEEENCFYGIEYATQNEIENNDELKETVNYTPPKRELTKTEKLEKKVEKLESRIAALESNKIKLK